MSDSAPTDIEKAFAWLVDNSDGVVGLKADGTLTPWAKVLDLYVPWWSARFADKELVREIDGVHPDDEEPDDDD